MKLNVAKAEDRDTLCVILCRNGYTVRQRKRGTMPAPFGGRIMVPFLKPSLHLLRAPYGHTCR